MTDKILIVCQGIHTSKIIAAILSHMPKYCIILRSFFDISKEITQEIDLAISNAIDYIEANKIFFINLTSLYEIKIDLMNPFSVVNTLERLNFNTILHSNNITVDISSGPIPTNIGLYLFALKNQISNITYSFPGERFRKKDTKSEINRDFTSDIEFAREFTFQIPIISVDFKEINDEIIHQLYQAPEQKVSSLGHLNELLHKGKDNLMQLSRDITRLKTIGLVKTKKLKKVKEVELTASGKTYGRYLHYEQIKLESIWMKEIVKD